MSQRSALIIVDMSVEQVSAIHYNKKSLIENCHSLGTSNAFDIVIDCRLWLRSPDESSLSTVYPETAKTMFVAESEGASLIPELLDMKRLVFVPKNNYSCFANSTLLSVLRDADIGKVFICGINTDYCVFATALDSFQNKFQTFVVEDAVTSVCGRKGHEDGLNNLIKHFGEGVLVKTKDVLNP